MLALDAVNGPVLTIEGRDAAGHPRAWYVRLWNYAVGTPEDAEVAIDFARVDGGFLLPGEADPVWAGDVDRMFVSLVAPGYAAGGGDLPAPVEAWVELTGIRCDGPGSVVACGDVVVPEQALRIANGYDDVYHLTPARVLHNMLRLGYRGTILHYVGMSHYFRLSGAVVTLAGGALNVACAAWHADFARRARALGFDVIWSLSYEVFDAHCPASWKQRAADGSPALTGWVPPSTLLSPTRGEAMAYLHAVARAFVAIGTAAGLAPKFQVGEPWWWTMTFEVVADEGDVAIGAVARALGEGAIVGDGPDDALAGFSASGSSVAGALGVLAEAGQAWFVPAGAGMAMRNRVATPRMLDTDVRVDLMRGAADAVPVALSVSHYDPARDFQVGTQAAHRTGAGWRDEAVELPAALSAVRARQIAEAGLLAREAARVRRRVTTDVAAIALAPGDAVALAGEGTPWRVARAALEEMKVVLDLVPVPRAAAARAADPGVVVGAPDLLVGRTVVAAFELPPLDDALPQVPQLLVAAAGTEPGWRGALLSIGRDGAAWEDAGATAAPATMGALATPLGTASATLVDRVHAVEIEFPHADMDLQSADAAALDRGANLALIGGELVQFATATPIGATRWRIAGLWRGRRGTAVAAHDAGARFVLIERAALVALPLSGVRAPLSLRVSATGVGDGGAAVEAVATLTGASVAPPAPVHLRATVGADGTLALRWVRRSRLGWRWDDGGDVPLVEEREAYRVTLPAGAGMRDATVAEPALDLAAGDWAPGTVTVRQLGTLAESAPATILI